MRGQRLAVLVATAVVLSGTAGCGVGDLEKLKDLGFGTHPFEAKQPALSCPAAAGGPLTLVVGARADSPAPQLPPPISDLLTDTTQQGKLVQVVRVDGAPSVALTATFATNGQNDEIRRHQLDAFISQATTAVTTLTPKKPEADVLGALTEAAQTTPSGGTIVLLDSGLATTGQLDFRGGDMFGVDPAEAVAYLKAKNLLPDLSGRSVVLVGLGRTADPQPALDPNLQSRVTALWHTVAEKAGASCVQDLTATPGRTSIATDVPVSLVPLPAPPVFHPCGTTVLADSDTVGFVPDQAVFRDPNAAKDTLQGLADQLRAGRQQVTLTGTTASWGPVASRKDLSHRRAEAVRDVLASLGVDGGRITTVGAGSDGPNHVDDLGPDGQLLPGPAAHNRSVVVDLACP